MSMGIVVTLPDGVVMIADGRDYCLFGEGPQIEDGVDKLQPIADRIYGIPFGVTTASRDAIANAEAALDESQVPLSIGETIDAAVAKAWDRFISDLEPMIDRHDSRLGVALVVAGLAGPARESFVCESIHSGHTIIPAAVGYGSPWITAIRGGEEQGSLERFNAAAQPIVAGTRSGHWKGSEGPHNAVTQALVEAAADTIAAAAQESQWIGWPIRAVVVRRGFPVLKDIIRWK